MRSLSHVCAASLLTLAGFGSAEAGTVTYTYGAAGPGQSSFTDAGAKLTDGNLGSTNINDGTWVGWQTTSETITFDFAVSASVSDVLIDFTRNDGGNVEIPDTVLVNGTSFSPANIADSTKALYDFSGSWTGTQIVLTLDNHNSGSSWDFVNEVEFTTVAPGGAPEPGTIGLALAGVAALLLLKRKRKPMPLV